MPLEVPFGRNLAFGTGEIADQLAYQGFTFMIGQSTMHSMIRL